MLKLITYADLISLLNICFGTLALYQTIQGNITAAIQLILLAIIADGLDGIVARKTGSGPLGNYLEAMGDMTSLTLAPLLLLLKTFTSNNEAYCILLLLGLLLYLICSTIRLASFHVLKTPNSFTGLPVSAAAITLIFVSTLQIEPLVLLVLPYFFSLLLISPISYPKNTMPINLITAVLVVFIIINDYTIDSPLPTIVFLLAISSYIVLGPLYLHFSKKKKA